MSIWSWIKSIFTKQNIKELSKDERILLLEENGYKVWTDQEIDHIKCGNNSVLAIKRVRINSSINGSIGVVSKLELNNNPLGPNYSTLTYNIDNNEYYAFFHIEFNKEKDIQTIGTVIEFIGCILEKYTLARVDSKCIHFEKTSPKYHHVKSFTNLKLTIDFHKEFIIIELYPKEPKKITFKELDDLGPREAYIKALIELNRYNMIYDL
jgi:hypothetical protein